MVEETAPQLRRDSNQLEREAKEENEMSNLVPSAPLIGDRTEEEEVVEQWRLSVQPLDGDSAPVDARLRI